MTETQSQQGFLSPEPYYEERPWLLDAIHRRNAKFKNFLMAATGDPGATKTYFDLYWAERADRDFDVELQCVFLPKQFWKAIEGLPTSEWRTIVWDDPTAGLSQRDWYMPLNKNVAKFIQTSARYRKKNIFFPLPAYEVLDKAVRKVTGYEAQMKDVGLAKVYRVKPNRFGQPEVWKSFLGEAQSKIPKCAMKYEKMRDEFTRAYFTEEEFEQDVETGPDFKWRRVYVQVTGAYSEFVVKDPQNPQNPGKLSPRLISALLDCSDNTARKVVTKIEYDQAT